MPGCSARSAVSICIFANKSGASQFNLRSIITGSPMIYQHPVGHICLHEVCIPESSCGPGDEKKELERNQI